jgi:hypothetical protein
VELSVPAVLARAIAIAAGGRRFGVFVALRLLVVCVVTAGFLSACLVDNPAYDPTATRPNDGGLFDGELIADADGFVLQPADAEELPPPDMIPTPFDAAEVPPPDAAVVKLDAAVLPPPDAAVVKLDAAVVPPPDAAVVNKTCASDPSLILCFDFENNTTKDLSATAMSVNTSSLNYIAGPSGTALQSSASTRIANAATRRLAVNAVTIQAWINPVRLPSNGMRFGIVDYQPQYALFLLPGGILNCGCDDTHNVTTAAVIKPGVWQSVACTMDDAALTIWVDGVVVAKKIPAGGFCAHAPYATGLSILGNNPAGTVTDLEQFEGLADNVRVWRRARTASEICSDALACKVP